MKGQRPVAVPWVVAEMAPTLALGGQDVRQVIAAAHRVGAPFLANNLANTPIRNSGDCGTVWACVEARRALQARSGATRSDGVLGSIPSVGSNVSAADRHLRRLSPAPPYLPLRVEEHRSGYPGVASEVLAFQSLIAGDQGSWEEAEEVNERAWKRTALAGSEAEPPLAVLLARARFLSRRDDAGPPDHRERVTRFLNEMPDLFEREVILGSVILGELWLKQGDVLAAERWRARAQTVLKTYPDAGMLEALTERLRLALQ